MRMKRRLPILLSLFLVVALAVWQKPFYRVPILNYHSVNVPRFNYDTPKILPGVFVQQMDFIHRMGYQVISLDDYIKMRKAGKRVWSSVVITFDDGYEDNYTHAFPVLKKYHFPATIFLIAKELDRDRFLKKIQIREMVKEGISFGSHTLSHAYLPEVSDEAKLRAEIFGSKKILETEVGQNVDYFSYPIGGYNDRVKELVRGAGYKAATTTNRGIARLNEDLYALKRIKITQRDIPGFVLWLKLSGYYLLFQGNREAY